MSAVAEYISNIEKILSAVPCRLSTSLKTENRGDAALFLKSIVLFSDGSELHFIEYLIAAPRMERVAYSYHYQDEKKGLLFRYDNSEHYRQVATYPHHRHDAGGVGPSEAPDLEDVLAIIIDRLDLQRDNF